MSFIFDKIPAGNRPGGLARRDDAPPRVVLHTTEVISPTAEAMRDRFAAHKWPPHIWCSFAESNAWTYKKRGGSATRVRQVGAGYDLVCQRVPLSHTAYALKHPKGTPETNHMGKYCIQVEIEGWAADVSNWPTTMYQKLAEQVLAPIGLWLRDNGYPDWVFQPRMDTGLGGEGWGNRKVDSKGRVVKGRARMVPSEWASGFTRDSREWNLCAHQEVPDNKHWDAGKLNFERLANMANLAMDGPASTAGNIQDALGQLEAAVKSVRLAVANVR